MNPYIVSSKLISKYQSISYGILVDEKQNHMLFLLEVVYACAS